MNNFSVQKESSLLEFNRQIYQSFQLICQPLFQNFPITHFFYGRVFKDGHYFFLSHNLEVVSRFENYIQIHNEAFFEKFVPIEREEIQKSIWIKEKGYRRPCIEHLRPLGICHGLNIVKRSSEDGSIENFIFSTYPPNEKIYNFYLNHFDLLDRFIFYFRKKSLKIIENPFTKKLAYSPFYYAEMQRIESHKQKQSSNFDLFINQTKMRQYNLKSLKGDDVMLSERQLECLYQLTKGRTAKEIALKLGVSFRTVQTHLNLVKERMGVQSRSSALECLSKESIHFLEASHRKHVALSW